MKTAAIVIVVILVLFLIWYGWTMNRLRALSLKVDEADSGIDVALSKRYNLLTKQLALLKEYVSYESKTLYDTISLRSGMSMGEKNEVLGKMDEVSKQFRVTVEAYPSLKASENFAVVQAAVSDVEEHLQAARRVYNANVTTYNTKIMMFPSCIIAENHDMVKRELFKAEDYQRQDVEMRF